MNRTTPLLTALGLLALAATPAQAQTNFPETEPNSAKIEANLINCMVAGDAITGSSTGGVTVAGNTALDTTDYFRVKTCALPLGVYRHTLTVSSPTSFFTGSMRGLTQTAGTPNAGTDVSIQTLTGNQQHWFGFGKGEEVITRLTGTPATTSPYAHTLSTTSPTVTTIGTFAPGSITITTCGQGHTTDTEVWIYDGNLNALAMYGNDDQSPPCPGAGLNSTLTQTYSAGTYYLALGTYNMANNLGSNGPGEGFLTGAVMDFPDAIMDSSASVPGNVAFAVTDTAGTTPVAATKTIWYEILWFKFDVGAGTPGTAMCEPTAAGVIACACGNPNGAGRGCANTGSAGASLASAGVASLATDAIDPGTVTLTGTDMLAGSSGIFLQGDAVLAAGVTFGAGIRCAGGTLKRLYVVSLVGLGGVKTKPEAGDLSISNRSAALGDVIGAGTKRWYQTYYRDPNLPNPGGSCPVVATFNITTGQEVTWNP